MNTDFQIARPGSPELVLQQNRVLRNTYMLLALSMVPTVIGALVGVQLQFSFLAGSPFIAFMLFMGVAFGFMWAIEKNKDSVVGVALLLGFTFFMGLMLSRILQVALGFANGGSMIALAAGGTGAIFFTESMFGVLRVVTNSTRSAWVSIGGNIEIVTDVMFRQTPRYDTPVIVAVLVLAGLVVLSVSVLERRVRGVEVVS